MTLKHEATSLEYRKWKWRYEIEDNGGWQYLLDGNLRAHILCLTRGRSLVAFVLSGIYEKVTHVDIDNIVPEELVTIRDELGYNNLEFVSLNKDIGLRDYSDAVYDGIVLHSPNSLYVPNIVATGELSRVLKPGGFIYIALANKFGYCKNHQYRICLFTEIVKVLFRIGFPFLKRRIESVVRRMELTGLTDHPLIMNGNRLEEVVPPTGYHSYKNKCTTSEKLRAFLLNRWSSKFIAPACAYVGYKDVEGQSLIDNLCDEIVTRYYNDDTGSRKFQLIKYMTLSAGKIVLLCGWDSKIAEVAVFVSQSELANRRREKEYILLEQLHEIEDKLPFAIPKYLGKFRWKGHSCFVQQAMPGITMDVAWRHMDRVTEEAVKKLIIFNKITMCAANEGEFDPLKRLDEYQRNAVDRMPALEQRLTKLCSKIRAGINGNDICSVCLHGDYKIENILVNEKSYKMLGVIDWELSEEYGFPWLDMIYLILYNRTITERSDLLSVFIDYLAHEKCEEIEKALIESYYDSLPISNKMEPLLTGLFFIHHLSCRQEYDLENEKKRRKVDKIIGLLEDRLG